MAFEFKSFEHFKQIRIKAAQWRAFDKLLKGTEGEELIRGVLQEPVIDNRTDRDYEKRLYQGFKEGMRRLREGVPLVDKDPPKSPPKDQFQEACISLGYLPSSSRAPPGPLDSASPRAPQHSSPPRQRRSSPPIPLLYPSTMFQRIPSPPSSPSSSVLLKATPPYQQFPSSIKTPTRIFSPRLPMSSCSPTPPPTPQDSHTPTYSDQSSEDVGWCPLTPSPLRREFESASFQPAIAEETNKNQKKTTTTPKETKGKPAPKRKRRKQQSKFSDEALKR